MADEAAMRDPMASAATADRAAGLRWTRSSGGGAAMTEEQWLACGEPLRMLKFLRAGGKASERKCRLLVCALARCLWPVLADERSRRAVEAAEAFADGGDLETLRQAVAECRQAHEEMRDAFIEALRATGGKYRRHVKEA